MKSEIATDMSHQLVAPRRLLLAGSLTACLLGHYLPWQGTTFLVVPLYLYTWFNRKSLEIDGRIKMFGLAFIGYMLFFSIFSAAPRHSFKGLYDGLRGLLLFPFGVLFAELVADRICWTVVNAIAFLFVVGEFFFPHAHYGHIFYSYSVNPNNAAVFLVIYISLLLPFPDFGKPYPLLIFPVCGLLTAFYLLLLTNGRGAWLGLAAGGVCLLVFRCGWRKRFQVLSVAIVLLILTGLFFYFNVKGFRLSQRQGLWEGLFRETLDHHFVFGYGFNAVKDLIDQLGLITRTAHNIFLEIFVSSGIVGIFFMQGFFYLLWKRFLFWTYPNSVQFLAGLVGITAFVVMGQFDMKFSSFRFIGTISFFLGMIYSQRQLRPSENKPTDNAVLMNSLVDHSQ